MADSLDIESQQPSASWNDQAQRMAGLIAMLENGPLSTAFEIDPNVAAAEPLPASTWRVTQDVVTRVGGYTGSRPMRDGSGRLSVGGGTAIIRKVGTSGTWIHGTSQADAELVGQASHVSPGYGVVGAQGRRPGVVVGTDRQPTPEELELMSRAAESRARADMVRSRNWREFAKESRGLAKVVGHVMSGVAAQRAKANTEEAQRLQGQKASAEAQRSRASAGDLAL